MPFQRDNPYRSPYSGRPRLSKGGISINVNFRLAPETWQGLKETARLVGVTDSQALREAIEDWIEATRDSSL